MAELKTGEYIYAEQVRQLYRLSRPAYIGSLFNSSILVFALWGVVSTTQLGAWLCVMFVVAGGRYEPVLTGILLAAVALGLVAAIAD